MFRLSREVRFSINAQADAQLLSSPTNSYAGYPSLTGLGCYFALQATVDGEPDAASGYLQNIKTIDVLIRQRCIPLFNDQICSRKFGGGGRTLLKSFALLAPAIPGLSRLRLLLSPFLSLECNSSELPMIRLSQKFEFSACHRLFNPTFTDEQNLATFGKCSNPHGHGHNYELQVTLKGEPDSAGSIIDIPAFERTIAQTIIDRFDHKNLNVELPEFRQVIPTVENIAAVIYRLLKPRFNGQPAQLAAVTVWETPKTSCEYSE